MKFKLLYLEIDDVKPNEVGTPCAGCGVNLTWVEDDIDEIQVTMEKSCRGVACAHCSTFLIVD